ncbi:hypothetical protein ACFE04_003941 [Oxalis oulophora]
MAQIHSSKFWSCILIFITLFSIPSDVFVDALETMKLKNGDMIDCVDIQKQLAFSHPLLTNHTLQIKPTSNPTDLLGVNSKIEPLEHVFEPCQCPEGTIPIIRNQSDFPTLKATSAELEYAQVSLLNGRFSGAQAGIGTWNPHVELKNEGSSALIWVIGSQSGKPGEFINAGWTVNTAENNARFLIQWTADNFVKTGCSNLNCPGFVQTSSKFVIGAPVRQISTVGGAQYELFVKIYQDKKTGNWWLQVQTDVIGYWPKKLFKKLADKADMVSWGGTVSNSKRYGRHTSTDMGSGHSPSGGYGKSAFFLFLGYGQESYIFRAPEKNILVPYATKPNCYDIHVVDETPITYGRYFFYGGPGFSGRCRN